MVGKTSLIKVSLNELKTQGWNTLYVNFYGARTLADATKMLVERINEDKSALKRLKDRFLDTESFSVGTTGVSWSGKSNPTHSLRHLISNLSSEDGKTVIVFDEIQALSRVMIRILEILKNILDNKGARVQFVFSGLKFGMLKSMTRETALSGRPPVEIKLVPFSREISRAFLVKGMAEHKLKLTNEELDSVVFQLDGLVGWLALFGDAYAVRKQRITDALSTTQEEGKPIVIGEFRNFARGKDEQIYETILKVLSSRAEFEWAQIKRNVETMLGTTIE